MQDSAAAAEFLGVLERKEAALLAWGLVEGSFTYDDLLQHAEAFCEKHFLWEFFSKPEVLVETLVRQRLLFSFWSEGQERYRTRMGESVRLLSRLRQLFPKHLQGNGWQIAPTLVADYRLLLRCRMFPMADVEPQHARQRLAEFACLDGLQQQVAAALLPEDGLKLRRFQLRAAESILAGGGTEGGTIVCAGTASGKTLAFYLPAYLRLAPDIEVTSHWTKCLAIYPRNELLKDQFSEAYVLARRIDEVLRGSGRRKLILGALFGATPREPSVFRSPFKPEDWRRTQGGFICPLLRCPRPDCGQPMKWLDEDLHQGAERLVCTSARCDAEVQEDEVILSRRRMLETPPDILFTTTEMLNQRLSDSEYGPLLGVGTPDRHKPCLVLLDETHTYGGTTGAQVAMLLRRWRHASRNRPRFVGLSATLRNAQHFFAQLIGARDEDVDEIGPLPGELRREGMEYLLALRGDPASGTALLSTTIQTAMLLRRTLDLRHNPCSEGRYGSKIFLFTDDLDVTNRLYFYLLNAEGQNSWGKPDPRRPGGSLANLRHSVGPDHQARFRLGQSWDLCETIGHALTSNQLIAIDRTSSQDKGVARDAEIVVATAALDVGFNDPEVGAVMQHKAPRDTAQFLQRKGRAGRRPTTRPWTVIVLSDFGRDRLAYQAYDLLFDPELPARQLPVGNRHVLRMQAAYALMDWLGSELRDEGSGSVWQDFSGPAKNKSVEHRQRILAQRVKHVLEREGDREELAQYLQAALGIDAETTAVLLWEPPRALMTAVLPTILRRLESNWQCATRPGEPVRHDLHEFNSPLPDFVPRALFNELNLPEVVVCTDPQQKDDEAREEPMRIFQAMREFAPGRVSRRFGIRNEYARHWIAPLSLHNVPKQNLPLHRYCEQWAEEGSVQVREGNEVSSLRCVRPWRLHPGAPPPQVADTSNAFLMWRTQIGCDSPGLAVPLPAPSPWDGILRELRFFTHQQRNPLEMRRFAVASRASITFDNGQQLETEIGLVDDGGTQPLAVGCRMEVDGLVLRFSMPPDLHVSDPAINPEKLRTLRTSRFRDLVQGSPALDGVVSPFARQWLAQVYLSALAYLALRRQRSLAEVARELQDFSAVPELNEVLDVIFQSIPLNYREEDDAEKIDDAGVADDSLPADVEAHDVQHVLRQRVHAQLLDLLAQPVVLNVLHSAAPVLWQEVDDGWTTWLSQKFQATLGAVLLQAVEQTCPDMAPGDLLLDIDPGPRPPGSTTVPVGLHEIWLTETAIGGGGAIEKLLSVYGEDPRRFFQLVEHALEPNDFEILDRELTRFLQRIVDPASEPLRQAVADLRAAYSQSHEDLAQAFRRLLHLLIQDGLTASHPVVVALQIRVLRPGSSHETDRLLHDLIARWRASEERLNIEIDARIFAYSCSSSTELDQALEQISIRGPESDVRRWRYNVLYSLLWPRGSAIRSRHLVTYNPFAALPVPERELVRDCLPRRTKIVPVDASDWFPQAAKALLSEGNVVLRAPVSSTQMLVQALMRMSVEPIEADFLLLYPRVARVAREEQHLDLVLELSETRQ
jgi:hypothetical protein